MHFSKEENVQVKQNLIFRKSGKIILNYLGWKLYKIWDLSKNRMDVILTMPTSESSEMESTNMVTPTVTAFPKIVRNSKIIFLGNFDTFLSWLEYAAMIRS